METLGLFRGFLFFLVRQSNERRAGGNAAGFPPCWIPLHKERMFKTEGLESAVPIQSGRAVRFLPRTHGSSTPALWDVVSKVIPAEGEARPKGGLPRTQVKHSDIGKTP